MPRPALALALVLVACVVAGCGSAAGHEAAAPAGWTTFHDPSNGLTVRFPSTWQRAGRSLTPALTDPRELLSLGTFAVPAARDGDCAHLPVAAMRAAGAGDVFVSIQERAGAAGDAVPARARPFAFGPAGDSEAMTCAGPPRPWRSYWVSFADAGRPLYALILVGDDAPAQRVAELHEVLDGLRFDPGNRFVTAHASGRLPEGWQTVDRRLTAAIGSGEQIAAATFAVPAGPPDGNCTPRAALDRLGPGDAFVYAFVTKVPGYGPPRPAHFTLDETARRPYECMGDSYMLRWHEHGVSVQAHVYLGSDAGTDRRAQALAFLDDLVIGE